MTPTQPHLASAPPTTDAADAPPPAWDLLREELSAGPVVWSVCVQELPERARGLGQVADGRPETRLSLEASTVGAAPVVTRLLVLLEAARSLDCARIDRDEVIPLVSEPGSRPGLLAALSPSGWTVTDLAGAVAAAGDEDAQATLVTRLGADEIDGLGAALGLPAGPDAEVAAADIARLVVGLHRGTLVCPAVSGQVRSWLSAGRDLAGVGAGLGLDPGVLSDPASRVGLWHAVAARAGCRSECGLVTGPAGSFAYAAVAAWAPGDPAATDAARRRALVGARRLGETLRAAVGA